MSIAETIALVEAGFKAVELYMKYGGTREQVLTTLNLEYQPAAFKQAERDILSLDATYARLFDAAGSRIQKCIDDLTKDGFEAGDQYLPSQRAHFGEAAARCICSQIKILNDFMGDNITEQMKTLWQRHGCYKYY